MACKKFCCPWIFVTIALVFGIIVAFPISQDPAFAALPIYTKVLTMLVHIAGASFPALVFFAVIKFLTCKKSSSCCCKPECCKTGSCNTKSECGDTNKGHCNK